RNSHIFFNLFSRYHVKPVMQYTEKLLATIRSVAPESIDNPNCVVLTPGIYNSAYFEHSFLAHKMGIQLVEGRDMYVDKNFVYMKTIHGPKRVDVIYRRVDDDFIDPLVFNPKSVLGVPGLMSAYRAGNVNIINAPGTGAADDKAVYTYIPDIIKYYLDEEPILKNVATYRCERPDELKYVLENMNNLVVKPVDESGGYGVFIGNIKTKEETDEYKTLILSNPRKYIAQPIMSLSMHSTFIDETEKSEQRHIDLRAFALMGKDETYVLEGGLTRVALSRGNLIVNSSQGGGSKDTWVIENQ
ncbi:MAG: circularly permuted type 2 ATP-grasp protein, partial [Cytophagales bacterium]|nr:circularly permuted type 2 ATP-grasp protein [Cytophaga sp.]